MHQVASLLSNHEQTLNRSIIVNESVYIGYHQQHSLQTTVFCLVYFFKSCRKYKLYSTSHLYRRYIQSNQPALLCNDITPEIERKQPIYAAAIFFI